MKAELRDSLEFLYPDSTVSPRPNKSHQIDVARNSTAAVHLLVNGLEQGAALKVETKDERGRKAGDAQWFRLIDVPVEENTSPNVFTEREGEYNEFVTRRAPFRVYDAMAPIDGKIRATAETMALRLHLPITAQTRPGERTCNITLSHKGEQHELQLQVNVHAAVVPPVGKDSWHYTNWYSLDIMATRFGCEPWSAAHWRSIRKHAELMAHGRQNVIYYKWGDVFTKTADGPVLDRQRLRKLVKTFSDAGLYYIEGHHVAGRTGGDWNATTFDVAGSGGVRATSPEGVELLAKSLGQVMEEIERNGWRDRWIQHVTDEPVDANAADYRILAGIVRRYMPGLPLLDATMNLKIAGSIDIWCPQVQEYQRNRDAFEKARSLGDKVWFYTCCAPGGPWLNRLLDQELLRPALYGWAAALFDLDGFLHWGLNHYRHDQNPFEQSVVGHGGSSKLPAGDTHVIYPGDREPWSSLRFEAQREGTEDFELFRILKQRDARRADAIVRRAIRGFDDYTKDVKAFRRAKKSLLEAL